MVVLIPIINLVGLVYFVGGDIQNVKVFYHNDDNNCMFIYLFIYLFIINNVQYQCRCVTIII